MSQKEFSMLELREVAIRSLRDFKFNDRDVSYGEIIALFDKITIANFGEQRQYVSARGGYRNRSWVVWQTKRDLTLNFVQGIFSKSQMAVMTNSRLLTESPEMPIILSKIEEVETNEFGKAQLSRIPAPKTRYFVYNKKTGEKLDIEISDTGEIVYAPYQELVVDYYYCYRAGYSYLTLGQELFDGFVQLQGKTTLQADETGKECTVVLTIPKLKILSNINFALGKNQTPLATQFSAVAIPVGDGGDQRVMEMTFLSDDVDSDIE